MKLGYRLEKNLDPKRALWYDEKLRYYFITSQLLEEGFLDKVLNIYDKLELMRVLYQYNNSKVPELQNWFGYYGSEKEYPKLYHAIKSKGKNVNWNNISNRVQYYYFERCQKLNHFEILTDLPLKIILEMKEQISLMNGIGGDDVDCRKMLILVLKEFEKGFRSIKSDAINKLSDLPEDLLWIRDVLKLAELRYWNFAFLSELSKYIHWYP